MADEKEINDLIAMLDAKADAGVGRIKVAVSDEMAKGEISESMHHGRCDITGECAPEITKNVK